MFQRSAEGLRGEEAALAAMGAAYNEQLLSDSARLRAQMQAYAACDDPEICQAVSQGFGDLVAYAERVSGLPTARVSQFFAIGMLLNVFASMNQFGDERRAVGTAAARRLQAILNMSSLFSLGGK